MNKWRRETFMRLARLGFTDREAATLVRCSATLHSWAEHECNGAIQRDEQTQIPYWYNANTGRCIGKTLDRETGALRRAVAIAATHGFKIYHQGDPRGCALYLYKQSDLDAYTDRVNSSPGFKIEKDIGCCYNNIGYAVIP